VYLVGLDYELALRRQDVLLQVVLIGGGRKREQRDGREVEKGVVRGVGGRETEGGVERSREE
jgi:hypothetical protein